MPSIKEQLQEAAVELYQAKFNMNEAQEKFDALFERIAAGTRAKGQKNSRAATLKAAQEQASLLEVNSTRTTQPTKVSDKIQAVLNSIPNRKWTYDEITAQLPETTRNTIRALLFKLKKDGKAQKAGRGRWKAAQAIHVNSSSNGADADTKAKQSLGEYVGMSQAEAILKALQKGPQTTAELLIDLNAGGQSFRERNYVTAVIGRLKDKVERVEGGKVKLKNGTM